MMRCKFKIAGVELSIDDVVELLKYYTRMYAEVLRKEREKLLEPGALDEESVRMMSDVMDMLFFLVSDAINRGNYYPLASCLDYLAAMFDGIMRNEVEDEIDYGSLQHTMGVMFGLSQLLRVKAGYDVINNRAIKIDRGDWEESFRITVSKLLQGVKR